ncbi:MAG: glycosyltransferase family 2 protein [Candidatus Diapherotrites archaeon]|uniref:Glycosyltransferase family 2 protein n=1 Tax=Candidatus Iainarchaeum sp. TaxID=3101447 RepID=A0A8T3YKJ4_9ARCH|nr:glycosyltransferase family 2 protein [Candidatus Diapherotrites archaeon]
MTNASIVVATYNNRKTLKKTLDSLLSQKFGGEFEVIVVNDGSTDGTKEFLSAYSIGKKRLVAINQENTGVCAARNAGIRAARYPIVINMDHDCIAEKDWLERMVAGFDSEKAGVVSAYDYYGGTSTGFRKSLLEKVGGYDEEYRYYREDTDLSFKIMDLGYEFRLVKARYIHDHEEVKPSGAVQFARHVLQRLGYHQNDVLLYKKHPTKVCEEFLRIRYGFLVSPAADFGAATGLWKPGGRLELSSPRGITFIENKGPLHALAIIIMGAGYVAAVKASRLVGSIRFGKLLV